MLIEGAISCKAAINNHKRKVNKVYIDKDKKTKDFNYILKRCKEENIYVESLNREDLSKIAEGKTFGGIIAEVENRNNDEFDNGDIFYLDGIEDPFNLGYIMRTIYAFGVTNCLLPNRDYSNMEAQLLKSSAGAYDMLNIKVVEDTENEIKKYKKNGYRICSLLRGDNSKDIFDYKFDNKTLIMIGGEKRGIASKLIELVDDELYIPYGSEFRNALNAAAASDVVATLLFKQRRKTK